MAKSINEINALNSLNKVQVLPEVKKPRRGGGGQRAKGSKATKTGGTGALRPRRASTASPSRAAQKRAQRTAARNLFASDVQVTGDSIHAKNLAVLSPLSTLAPGASLRAVPGRAPVMMFDTNAVPAEHQSLMPDTARVSIPQLYSLLAPSLGSAQAYDFCESMLNERWQTWTAAEKSWQEDEAENAKLSEQASERAQQRTAEQKHQHDASQAQVAAALKAAQASLNAKHATVQASRTRKQIRPHAVSAPVRTSSTVAAPNGTSDSVVTSGGVDTLDNTPVVGLALAAPATPPSRPAPASPQERGARQAKRLRQSADADMI